MPKTGRVITNYELRSGSVSDSLRDVAIGNIANYWDTLCSIFKD